jgi:Lamin Tail Domain/Secretion system C-terminal sorting domain
MKKALLFFGLLASTAYAQDCSKLFISEYVEGWSNNKALEIYNPTNQAIDLSEYFVARYSNGSASATVANAVQLSGTVQPHDVFVAALDKQDPAGSGQEAALWDSLIARADGFFSPVYNTSNAFYWNGNDAVMLAKGTLPASSSANVTTSVGFQIIDIFGKIGEDPSGGSWTTTAPYNTGVGVGVTEDHSLIRKSTVLKGVTAQVTVFNALGEYDSIPAVTYMFDANGDTIVSANGNAILFGNWFSLGTHECDCNSLSTEAKIQADVVVYPNPSLDGMVYIKGAVDIREVQVLNALGQLVSRTTNTANPQMAIKLGADRGVYIVRLIDQNGAVTSKRVVVK